MACHERAIVVPREQLLGVIPKSVSKLKMALPDLLEDAENGLSVIARQFISELYAELKELIARIDHDENGLKSLLAENEDYQRLMEIPGFGPIISSAIIASVGDATQFKSGREFAAWTGLTPRQYASGETSRMGSISKRGNRYLRTLFIHGARAAFSFCKKRDHHMLQWADQLAERHGKHKACVALANKQARIAWAILTKKTNFEYRQMTMV